MGIRLVAAGTTAVDTLAHAGRIPHEPVPLSGRIVTLPGGRAANMAVAATRLGAHAALISCVGADGVGAEIVEHLRGQRIDLSALTRVEARTDQVCAITTPTGEQRAVVDADAGRHLDARRIEAARRIIADAEVTVASAGIAPAAIAAALDAARAAGRLAVFNPAPMDEGAAELIGLADVVTVNATEARQLTGIHPRDADSARRAADDLMSRGPRVAVVTAGAAGDLFRWPHGEVWQPPPAAVTVVDTTGAGDAMTAALALRLAEGADLEEAARFAAAAGALTTSGLGAQAAALTRDQVQTLAATGQAPPVSGRPASVSSGQAPVADGPAPVSHRPHAG